MCLLIISSFVVVVVVVDVVFVFVDVVVDIRRGEWRWRREFAEGCGEAVVVGGTMEGVVDGSF